MYIPYYQVNPFILNSYKLRYANLLTFQPKITLESYIKSQLHCNIVTPIYGRSLLQYKEAFDCLTGNSENIKSLQKVLQWYYEDLGNFILNTFKYLEEDFSIIDTSILKPSLHLGKVISLNKVESDLEIILNENRPVEDGEFDYIKILLEINLLQVPDLKPSRILAEMLTMKFIAFQKESYVIGVK